MRVDGLATDSPTPHGEINFHLIFQLRRHAQTFLNLNFSNKKFDC
jgi:hypothetical protein